MKSRDLSRFDMRVPKDARNVLEERVRYEEDLTEDADLGGYWRKIVEEALATFAESDRYAGLEEQAKGLMNDAGLELKETELDWKDCDWHNQSIDLGSEKVRVVVYIESTRLERFKERARVEKKPTEYLGDMAGRAFVDRAMGGRPARLSAMMSVAREQIRAGTPDTSSSSTESVDDEPTPLEEIPKTTVREEKEARVAEELEMDKDTPEEMGDVHERELQEVVNKLADGDTASDATLTSYREALLETYGYAEHPVSPMFFPEEHFQDDVNAILELLEDRGHVSPDGSVGSKFLKTAVADYLTSDQGSPPNKHVRKWVGLIEELTGAETMTNSNGHSAHLIPELGDADATRQDIEQKATERMEVLADGG